MLNIYATSFMTATRTDARPAPRKDATQPRARGRGWFWWLPRHAAQ